MRRPWLRKQQLRLALKQAMHIFLASIEFLNDTTLFDRALQFASKERQQRALAYTHQTGRARSLGAALLLDEALRRTFKHIPLPAEIIRNKYSAPSIKNEPSVYISISHAGNYAAAAVSTLPIGVDVETIRKCREGLCRKCLAQDELELVLAQKTKEDADLAFTRLWTRKESYIKAIGKGLAQPLAQFSALKDEIIMEEKRTNFFCRTYMPKTDCIVSVCSEKDTEKDTDFPQEINIVDLQACLEASAS